jgi:hypothetical protein
VPTGTFAGVKEAPVDPSPLRERVDALSARLLPTTIVWIAGLLWLSSVNWKVPPRFGESAERCSGLCGFVQAGIDHPVVPGSGWVLDNIVQPQLGLFGWITLVAEVGLAVLLVSRRYLRTAAVLGVAQSLAIGLTVANAPDEWYWAYLLMVGLHLAVLAFAPMLRPTSVPAMAVLVATYGVIVAVAHAGAGFTGGGNDPWTLFTGDNDIPDEFGRGTFRGSIALGLLFVAVGAVTWGLARVDRRTRTSSGYLFVLVGAVLLLTYRADGLVIGLGSAAVSAAVLAAAGLALTAPTPGDADPGPRASRPG